MASELDLLSLTQHQKFSQLHSQQSQPLMWNPKQMAQEDDDDSWEVRAFEQDSTNITWPPPSYTCAYCAKVFRSAQALGGHMNVHRRERARLHQGPPGMSKPTSISVSPTFLIPSQEIVTNGRLCFLYSLPNPNGIVTPRELNSCMKSPSNFAPVTPFVTNNLFPSCPTSYKSLTCEPYKFFEPSASNRFGNRDLDCDGSKKFSAIEELDLELRLSRR